MQNLAMKKTRDTGNIEILLHWIGQVMAKSGTYYSYSTPRSGPDCEFARSMARRCQGLEIAGPRDRIG